MAAIDSVPGIANAVAIGIGGFGSVYRAIDTSLNRPVAVKLLDLQPDEPSLETFRREVAALSRLSNHPNIVTLYSAEITDQGLPYIVMEYASRGSLAGLASTDARVDIETVRSVGIKVCEALQAAHSVGIIHRDIKPSNILISDHGEPLLADFGIATLTDRSRTRSRNLTASIAHASPEQIGGERVDNRTDVYSLGSTLYELLQGRSAFAGEDDEAWISVLRRIGNDDPPPLPEHVPFELREVVLRAMRSDREERFQSTQEFAEAIEQSTDPGGDLPRVPLSRTTVDNRIQVDPQLGEADAVRPEPSRLAAASRLDDQETCALESVSSATEEPPATESRLGRSARLFNSKWSDLGRPLRLLNYLGLVIAVWACFSGFFGLIVVIGEEILASEPWNVYSDLQRTSVKASLVAVGGLVGSSSMFLPLYEVTRHRRWSAGRWPLPFIGIASLLLAASAALELIQGQHPDYLTVSLAMAIALSVAAFCAKQLIVGRSQITAQSADSPVTEGRRGNTASLRAIVVLAPMSLSLLGLTALAIARSGPEPAFGLWNTAVAWSPDGTTIATASPTRLRLWDSDGNGPTWEREVELESQHQLAWDPTGELIAIIEEGSVSLWHVRNGTIHTRFNGRNGFLPSFGWSPDGQAMAVAEGSTVWFFSTDGGLERTWEMENEVSELAWSPDGSVLAIGGFPSGVTLWDPVSGVPLGISLSEPASVSFLGWGSDGTIAVEGDSDGHSLLVLWDPLNDTRVELDQGDLRSVELVVLAPDGSSVGLTYSEWSGVYLYEGSGLDLTVSSVLRPEGLSAERTEDFAWDPTGTRVAAVLRRTGKIDIVVV